MASGGSNGLTGTGGASGTGASGAGGSSGGSSGGSNGLTGTGGASGTGGTGAGGSSGGSGGGRGGAGQSGTQGTGGAGGGAGQVGSGGAAGGAGGQGGAGNAAGGLRQILNINQSWKFLLGDHSGAQMPSFDDSAWSSVGLPHSFSLPYFLWTKFYVGYGWYRKHFSVPASWSGKRVFIEFQAAFQDAQIYVNGTQVGEHMGGYNGFSIDISSQLVTGDNVVAVRLNNNWNARIAPRAGDHTFSGGLYRDVNVVVTDPLHVTWYGTWVTTPTLATNSGSSSTVEIKTEVQNDGAAGRAAR